VATREGDGTEHNVLGGRGYISNATGWQERELTDDEKSEMNTKMISMIADMQSVRDSLIFKNEKLLELAESKFNITQTVIREELAKADAGDIDVDEMLAKSPVQLPHLRELLK